MTEEAKQKDNWDKAEILGKAVGAVLVPLAVTIAVFSWNSERTRQQTAASVTPLAVSILTTAPSDKDTTALREWAIAVMNNPSEPPALVGEAARSLSTSSIKVPPPPDEVTKLCEKLVALPPEALTQAEVEVLWRQDRLNLLDCAGRHELLVAWSEGIVNVFSNNTQ